jgi:hypothetical protein
MSLVEARKRCPQAVILDGCQATYHAFAERVWARLAALTPDLDVALDERTATSAAPSACTATSSCAHMRCRRRSPQRPAAHRDDRHRAQSHARQARGQDRQPAGVVRLTEATPTPSSSTVPRATSRASARHGSGWRR